MKGTFIFIWVPRPEFALFSALMGLSAVCAMLFKPLHYFVPMQMCHHVQQTVSFDARQHMYTVHLC